MVMEKKRMTKAEAIELLKNRKVYVNGKSAEIQKKLFELDFEWPGVGKEIINQSLPFIYTSHNYISGGDDMDNFIKDNCAEISAEEILAIEVVEDCPFKPFDRVLVRASGSDIWRADIFSHYYPEKDSLPPAYSCVGGLWAKCIHYTGNESILGTTNNPE